MAGFYCHINAVTFASGRLQVAYELRNGDLVAFSIVNTGQIGLDVTQLAGSTPAQKLASAQASVLATFTQINASNKAASDNLAALQAFVGVNVPAAP